MHERDEDASIFNLRQLLGKVLPVRLSTCWGSTGDVVSLNRMPSLLALQWQPGQDQDPVLVMELATPLGNVAFRPGAGDWLRSLL